MPTVAFHDLDACSDLEISEDAGNYFGTSPIDSPDYSESDGFGGHPDESTATVTCPDNYLVFFEFADGQQIRTSKDEENAECNFDIWEYNGNEVAHASCAGTYLDASKRG